MEDAFIGEIRVFAGHYAPPNWALCEGQLLNIRDNQVLYSIIGNKYGGDGKTTFALPDLRGCASMGQGAGPGLTERKTGDKTGAANITLTQSELPAHKHVPVAITSVGTNSSDPTGRLWAEGKATGRPPKQPNLYSTNKSMVQMNGTALSSAGEDQPHNNMQPYIPMSFIICVSGGEFPVKPNWNKP